MSEPFDLSRSKLRKTGRFGNRLKKQVVLQLDPEVVGYFKSLSSEKDIPYQSLIGLYLKDCMREQRTVEMSWGSSDGSMREGNR